MCSSEYLIPLPLYGSGGLTDLISAATCPTFCLSTPDITISVWLGVSIVIPYGITKLTGWEKPTVNSTLFLSALAL